MYMQYNVLNTGLRMNYKEKYLSDINLNNKKIDPFIKYKQKIKTFFLYRASK